MLNRTISPLGLAQIEAHEGFWPEAMALPDGRWLVGYGHVSDVKAKFTMTKQEAAAVLVSDLAPAEAAVNALCQRPLTQSQFDALVSFTFSVGVDAFSRSDVLRRVKDGEFGLAACALEAWRRSEVAGGDGAVYEALVRRRAAEKALLLSESAAAPSAWIKPKLDHAAAILGAPLAFGELPALTPAQADEDFQPAHDEAPLMLTHQAAPAPAAAPVSAGETPRFISVTFRAPKKRIEWDKAGFAALIAVGAVMAVMGVAALFGRPSETGGATATLLLGLPGLAAAFAGWFFLNRGVRPVFASV